MTNEISEQARELVEAAHAVAWAERDYERANVLSYILGVLMAPTRPPVEAEVREALKRAARIAREWRQTNGPYAPPLEMAIHEARNGIANAILAALSESPTP